MVTVRYLFVYDPTNYETSPFSVLLRVASHPSLEEKNRIRIRFLLVFYLYLIVINIKNRIRIYTMTTKIVFLISVLSLLSYCASIPVEEVKLKWGNI